MWDIHIDSATFLQLPGWLFECKDIFFSLGILTMQYVVYTYICTCFHDMTRVEAAKTRNPSTRGFKFRKGLFNLGCVHVTFSVLQ